MLDIRDLLKAGAHFGHQRQKWNPKMAPYIYTERNGIHIINLQKTMGLLETARNLIKDIAMNGGDIFLVGTKRQAQEVVQEAASRAEVPFVNYRWLGGMLTNFATISKSIKTLSRYEDMMSEDKRGRYTKKELIRFDKLKAKLSKNLSGIVKMKKMPAVMVVVDPVREHLAIKEASKLGIPIVAIIDTNANPDLVDYPIPANDDGMRTISLIINDLVEVYEEGHDLYKQKVMTEERERKDKPVRGETRNVAGRKVKVKRIATSEAGDEKGEEVVEEKAPEKGE